MGCNCGGGKKFSGSTSRLSTNAPTSPRLVQSSTMKTPYQTPPGTPTGPSASQTLRKTV
jgi:hypothetical protein